MMASILFIEKSLLSKEKNKCDVSFWYNLIIGIRKKSAVGAD